MCYASALHANSTTWYDVTMRMMSIFIKMNSQCGRPAPVQATTIVCIHTIWIRYIYIIHEHVRYATQTLYSSVFWAYSNTNTHLISLSVSQWALTVAMIDGSRNCQPQINRFTDNWFSWHVQTQCCCSVVCHIESVNKIVKKRQIWENGPQNSMWLDNMIYRCV